MLVVGPYGPTIQGYSILFFQVEQKEQVVGKDKKDNSI